MGLSQSKKIACEKERKAPQRERNKTHLLDSDERMVDRINTAHTIRVRGRVAYMSLCYF